MFYSNYIVGFEKLVQQIVENKYDNIKINQMLNSAAITETSSLKNLINLPFLNNHFFVFKYIKEAKINTFINSIHNMSLKK